MAYFVHGILLLWLLVIPLACCVRVSIHLVIAAALVLGLLFLPMVDGGDVSDSPNGGAFAPMAIPGLALTKYKVLSLAILLGVLLRDGGRLRHCRLSWVDLPMILWCLCPIPSLLGAPPPPNGADPMVTSMTQVLEQVLLWGAPYYIGKQYFGSWERLRDLAGVFVLGALLYIPFCLYEVRMSPQLHVHVYGFSQHNFGQTIRFDGFRPMVFMQHGLAVGLYLALALLAGGLLWWSGSARSLPGPAWMRSPGLVPALLLALALTAVLVKSTGALLLGVVGIVVLVSVGLLKRRWPLVCLLLVCPLFLIGRLTDTWPGVRLATYLRAVVGQERVESFWFRHWNEELLMARAFEGPPFGWAGWGRNFVRDKEGRNLTICDSLWIITLGVRGLPGLIVVYLAMLLPVARFVWRQPAATWFQPKYAGATACALVVVLYMIDNLVNDMHNHVFILMAGALSGLALTSVPTLPPPLSVTDRRLFLRSLWLTRRSRSRLPQSG